MRALWTVVHRWVGLFLAAFLVMTGLTGAVLSWDHELDDWLNADMLHTPGRGPLQTPLQLAQATALIASKGKWNRPHLAKTIEGQPPVDPNPMEDIVLRDKSDWAKVTHGMEQVMHGARGTARKAAIGVPMTISSALAASARASPATTCSAGANARPGR